ncbi:FHA domain-containing protein [Pseudochelatococcus sp. G4_1912]|uniref:FHA domain-containing protein n=1 Tax=Pseudochelatococcus sp. G4_1912 TaxID=3114288 RepID=UPI0039C6BB67
MTDEGLTDPDAMSAGVTDGTILKILSGVQSGVEVSLSPGLYTLGSGGDDDIQIIDVSLAPGHLQLRVGAGAIQVKAAAGSVRTGNGIALDPDSEWHEVEPLDILTAGTTRLALGPSTAAWTSVTDIDDEKAPAEKEEAAPERQTLSDILARIDLRKQALPLLALVMVLGLAIWYLASDGAGRSDNAGITPANVAEVRAALVPLPFARNIEVRQEVDGTIYATGYVDSTVERRAVAGAIEETGVPVHLRVWVLQSMRQEIEGLIAAQKRNVTFDISRTGVVTLNGLIPDDAQAAQFISTIREGVLGVTSVESNLRTPTSLLADVEKLAQSSRIKPWVLFRFDQGVIEATGALPADEVDSWSGFLQVYARRFAPDVGLRSFVQLQDINVPPSHAITIGAAAQNTGDVEVDVSRIQQGNFTSEDVLIGAPQSRQSISEPVQQPSSNEAAPNTGGLLPGNNFPSAAEMGLDQSANAPDSDVGRSSDAAVSGRSNLSSLRPRVGMQSLLVAPAADSEAVKAEVRISAVPGEGVGMRALQVLPPREKMTAPVMGNISLSSDGISPVSRAGMRALIVSPAEEEPNTNVIATVGISGNSAWLGIEGFNAPLQSGSGALQNNDALNASLSNSTRLLLEQWRDGRLQGGANANSLMQALERLSREGGAGGASRLARQQLYDRYLPAASGRVEFREDAGQHQIFNAPGCRYGTVLARYSQCWANIIFIEL